jgi:hypothetical protein
VKTDQLDHGTSAPELTPCGQTTIVTNLSKTMTSATTRSHTPCQIFAHTRTLIRTSVAVTTSCTLCLQHNLCTRAWKIAGGLLQPVNAHGRACMPARLRCCKNSVAQPVTPSMRRPPHATRKAVSPAMAPQAFSASQPVMPPPPPSMGLQWPRGLLSLTCRTALACNGPAAFSASQPVMPPPPPWPLVLPLPPP